MIEFTIDGLNQRQRVLADIMWALEDYDDVERFIGTLPPQFGRECRTIIELMKMAIMEQCQDDGGLNKARKVLQKYNTKKKR